MGLTIDVLFLYLKYLDKNSVDLQQFWGFFLE